MTTEIGEPCKCGCGLHWGHSGKHSPENIIDELDFSFDEVMWLNQHGGRRTSDVLVDEHGRKYVIMSVGRGLKRKVYLPKNYGNKK